VKNQKFELLSDLELPRALADTTIEACWFWACHYGDTAKAPLERRRITNLRLVGCKSTNNAGLGPVLVEDVEVDGLSTSGLCIAWGAAFRHVQIRGKCGRFMLSPLPSATPQAEKRSRRFEADNARFYRTTDWALDIADGEFEELDVRNVPASLVRRDQETQVVVKLGRVESTQEVWQRLDLSGTPWALALSNMLRWRSQDRVLVAPKRSREFPRQLAGLRLLRKEGVAESE
jgi:hypothetical protein